MNADLPPEPDFWITAGANGEEVFIKIRGQGVFWFPPERAQDIRDQLTLAIERAVRAQAVAVDRAALNSRSLEVE